MKILITDPLAREGVEILREAGLETEEAGTLDERKLVEKIKGVDGLIVRSATRVTGPVIMAADRLKIIGRAGVGLDNVDLEAATEKGVIVMNSPEGNTASTAEHAFALILALARNVPQACASVKENRWEKKRFTGTELTGKTIGIIGFGRIGQRVARYARAFDMKVLAHDPFINISKGAKTDVSLVDMDDLLAGADVITLHLPLTEESEKLIGSREIGLMKQDALLVNCARGGLVDESAAAEALRSGKLRGAAFDVFVKEPPEPEGLISLPNVVATPHLGASTEEAQEKVARAICDQVVDYLSRGTIRNAANLPPINREQLSALKPYLNLAEKMGRFLAQGMSGNLEATTLSYCGEIAELDVASLPHYFLKGLLDPGMGSSVNYVNAPLAAKERGINFSELKTSSPLDFSSVIVAEISSGGKKFSVTGTLFGKSDPRIVKIDDYLVDAVPDGNLLLCRNEDKAGIIGRIGTILASSQINIAGMTLGRTKKGGPAVTILNIDGAIAAPVLEQIKLVPHVQSVKLIKL